MKQNTIKIIVISDTHGKNQQIKKIIDQKINGDIFIHAGDFTQYNSRKSCNEFIDILSQLNFQHKIILPGNHQIIFDGTMKKQDLKGLGLFHIPQQMKREKLIERIQNAGGTYIEHDLLQIKGLRFFFSSYTPISFYQKTGFQLDQEQMKKAWDGVPKDINILVTHGPPHGILDKSLYGQMNAGCPTIKSYLEQCHPMIHIFGHIHEGKGQKTLNGTRFYNISEKLHIIQIPIESQQK